jgi:hypothetical protein
MIQLPSRAVSDYLAGFGLGCIFVTSSGKLGVGCDLARVGPVAAAWWVRDRCTADQVIMAMGERHPATIEGAAREIMAAAARLDVVLSEHSAVLARAKAAVAERSALAVWHRRLRQRDRSRADDLSLLHSLLLATPASAAAGAPALPPVYTVRDDVRRAPWCAVLLQRVPASGVPRADGAACRQLYSLALSDACR